MRQYASILSAMRSQLWMVQPEKLEAVVAFLQLKAQGKDVEAETFEKIHGAAELQAARAQKVTAQGTGSVAVLPLYGLLLHRGMSDVSGPSATSTAKFTRQFKAAVNDPNITAIVIDVDSPGGTVQGVDELATEIRAARGKKKTIAVSNMQCCSAAYYIASACDEVVASPSSQTGSIGVYCVHEDISGALDKAGVKVTMIKFGENKAEANGYEPLSKQARDHLQEMVDEAGHMFENAVAAGRRISKADVHKTFGQGMVFGATQAKALGLVDTIATLDQVLARFGITDSSAATSIDAAAGTPRMLAAEGGDEAEPCDCPCDSCADGDCDGCSTEDCGYDGCTCAMAAKKRSDQMTARAAARRRQAVLAGL